MMSWLFRAIVVTAMANPAIADDFADFNAAVERAAAHTRIAIDLLRTQSGELAVDEITQAKDAWGDLTSRFGAHAPAVFKNEQLYVETMVDIPTRLVAAMMMLDMGRPDIAHNSLQAIRVAVSNLRRDAGIDVLTDCVLDYNVAMAAFAGHEQPDWSNTETASKITAQAGTLAKTAMRCDKLADEKTRAQPEFRRLIDGMQKSLASVPKAVAAHDSDLLRRAIDELRAFDRLLMVRYG